MNWPRHSSIVARTFVFGRSPSTSHFLTTSCALFQSRVFNASRTRLLSLVPLTQIGHLHRNSDRDVKRHFSGLWRRYVMSIRMTAFCEPEPQHSREYATSGTSACPADSYRRSLIHLVRREKYFESSQRRSSRLWLGRPASNASRQQLSSCTSYLDR